jgi:dipeptidase
MELIGKGKWSKGAVWVAMRVPDGHIGGHANQARITTFPRNDPDNCLYSHDVVSFAVQAGLYPPSAPADDFSFADAYDPLTWSGARFCDARVWSFFSQVAEPGFEARHEDYVTGKNLSQRMPLFVKAARKVSVANLFGYMRNHYERTVLSDQDISAGPMHTEFRVSPSHWTSSGRTYVNERHVGVPVRSPFAFLLFVSFCVPCFLLCSFFFLFFVFFVFLFCSFLLGGRVKRMQ